MKLSKYTEYTNNFVEHHIASPNSSKVERSPVRTKHSIQADRDKETGTRVWRERKNVLNKVVLCMV